MIRRLSLMAASLLVAACSADHGSTAMDSGTPGGSGGSGGTPSGSGGATPTGSGGGAPQGSGGSPAGSGGSDGAAGAGGADAAVMGTGGMMMAMAGSSVTQRGNDVARTAHYVRPMLTRAKAATMAVDAGFTATYTGDLHGTPLYLENGPGGKGAFFVATMGNNVYAFDETTGKPIWTTKLGTGGPGGRGVQGTPAIDPVSRTLFLAAGAGGTGFKAHALNIEDGMERTGWPIDLGVVIGGNVDLTKSGERGSLLLVNGILYIPLGGGGGDGPGARGRVVAIDIADPMKTGTWASMNEGSSLWAPGGMASDGTAVFAITGNVLPYPGNVPDTHADSEEVIRFTGLAKLTRDDANIYYPARWKAMDLADLDFGANSPVVMDVPGATPSRYIVGIPKDGHVYFLDPNKLGGMGGHKFDLTTAQEGMSIAGVVPAAYQTAKGAYVVFKTQGARGCPAGGANGQVLMSVLVSAVAGAINPTIAWCAPAAAYYPPSAIVTTTDGKADAVVWHMNMGVLKGLDGDTGEQIYSGGACDPQRWTSPIAVKGARIVVGGNGKLCSWSAK